MAASGWKRATEVDAIELIERMQGLGARRIIYTDISRDGMLSGPNLESVRQVVSKELGSRLSRREASRPSNI